MPQVNDQQTGSAYWRSLEEYAQAPEVRDLLKQEFSGYDPEDVLSVSRRRFVQIMAASLSLAGLTLSGCRRWPEEKLAPFASRPAGHTPGVPTHYASIVERGGVANGVLVSSFDGRPIKVEGNPLHPGSLGASDAFTQAGILQMYDPYRLRQITKGKDKGDGTKPTWADFKKASDDLIAKAKQAPATFAVLSEQSSSPSLARLKSQLLSAFPGAKWYEYEPINRDNEIQGARDAFGKPVRPQYHLDKAEVVVCFDSDLLGSHLNQVRHARDWAKGRKSADEGTMSRLYAAESTMTITGSVADHRLPVRSAQVGALVLAVAQKLGLMNGSSNLNGSSAFVEALVKDLQSHRGKGLVVAGPNQPPQVHALCWAINDELGNVGATVDVIEEPELVGGSGVGCFRDISELVRVGIEPGKIKHLLILGGNPAYDAPADLKFAEQLGKLETAIHLTEYRNETSALCHWQLPKAHYLECWGDGRAWDGTLSVQQPLILPIARKGAESKSPIELVAMMLGEEATDGYTIVRQTFGAFLPTAGFESAWRKTLHEGLVAGSAYKPQTARPKKSGLGAPPLAETQGFELTFQPDPGVYDGRFADNGWLQELPGPLTKMTWDNAALLNIADAKEKGIHNGDIVEIKVGEMSIQIAAYLMPGQARGSVALPLGYGRTAAGPVGTGVGFDTYKLRTSTKPGIARDATIQKVPGKRHDLALTQNHHLIDPIGEKLTDYRVGTKGHSGSIIKEATFDQYRKDPKNAWKKPGEHAVVPLQLWDSPYKTEPKHPGAPEAFNEPHAWGMTIDMNACIGCNACVVACQAENNVPVVGKNMVLMSREMQWLRIDRYFKNDRHADPDAENPQVVHQPMMCQQCENAPCEQVCPVAATVHDAEGLNVMVYNRCIGTRYCSNNCPYKVRRFNYFDYHSKDPRGSAKPWVPLDPLKAFPDQQQLETIDKIKRMVYNPDVTVRMRGVMEKCTYCIQRIKRNTIDAKNKWARGERDKPTVDDGAIVTACQQSCPTQAIVFGDLNDADSEVTRSQRNPRAYMVLEELNTRTRTKYLAKLRNPKT